VEQISPSQIGVNLQESASRLPSEEFPLKADRSRQAFINQADAPPCPDCGCLMVRNGTCYKCLNCGATSGCS
jgi:ribonucleoside-diphosphate reductase alpha chain